MQINLFQRFALVRYWRLTKCLPFSAFLSKDELLMKDWSYGLEHRGSDPPWSGQRLRPETGADWQGDPVRVRAPHRC